MLGKRTASPSSDEPPRLMRTIDAKRIPVMATKVVEQQAVLHVDQKNDTINHAALHDGFHAAGLAWAPVPDALCDRMRARKPRARQDQTASEADGYMTSASSETSPPVQPVTCEPAVEVMAQVTSVTTIPAVQKSRNDHTSVLRKGPSKPKYPPPSTDELVNLPPDADRKVRHNLTERRRIDRMNQLFDRLHRAVSNDEEGSRDDTSSFEQNIDPDALGAADEKLPKICKAQVLEGALQVIQDLRRQLAQERLASALQQVSPDKLHVQREPSLGVQLSYTLSYTDVIGDAFGDDFTAVELR